MTDQLDLNIDGDLDPLEPMPLPPPEPDPELNVAEFKAATWLRLQRVIVGLTREDSGSVMIEKIYGPVGGVDPKLIIADIAAANMLLTVLVKVFTVLFPPPVPATGATDETDPTRKQEGEDHDSGGVAE